MGLIDGTLVGLIGGLHGYILVLEMFMWETKRARKAFGTTAEFAAQSKTLAANQGLYNGFLAAGLFWGLLHPVDEFAVQIQLFFLGCVGVAGVYGGATVSPRILMFQAVPASTAIAAILFLH